MTKKGGEKMKREKGEEGDGEGEGKVTVKKEIKMEDVVVVRKKVKLWS